MPIDKKAVAAMSDGLNGIEGTIASDDIQKRGHTYPGDGNSSFGIGNGQPIDFINRYNSFHNMNMLGGPSFVPFNLGLPGYPSIGGGGSSVALDNRNHIAHVKMALATEAYKGFGVIKNVIDLMCNFASEGLTIQHPRPGIEKFYKRWAECVDLEGRAKDILRQYYKYGNVFIYTSMGQIDKYAYNKMMTAKADTNDAIEPKRFKDAENESKKPIKERMIPWRYTLLNPFQMNVKGGEYFGENKWVFTLDEKTYDKYRESSGVNNAEQVEFLDDTKINLPQEFKELTKGRDVELDQTKLWTMHYMKDDHEDWADPMIWPVIGDVMYKNKLRAMDMSVCDSAISAVTIFKIGNLSEGFIAPPEHMSKFAQMLRTPTYAMNMVWNDAISVESSYPPVDKILGVAKYESVDKDIMKGLGIPEILLGGDGGGSYSSAFLGVRTLLERLEEGRREVIKWINKQLRLVATIMGHRDIPSIRFGQMSLRDETAEKQLIMGLLDRDVISVEAVHDIFGQDFEVEVERMKREKKIAEDTGILAKHGPFKDPMTDLDEEEKIKLIKKPVPNQQEPNELKINGRPPGTKNIKQKKKRETKPVGMASISEYEKIKDIASEKYSSIEKLLTDKVTKLRNVKYWKALSQDDKDGLDGLILKTFMAATLNTSVTEEWINSIIATDTIVELEKEQMSLEDKRKKRIVKWAASQIGD